MVWDDPGVDWAGSTSPCSARPGTTRRAATSSWPGRASAALANPADVVRVEHRQALPRASSPRPACRSCPPLGRPGESWQPPPAAGEYVIKPAVSAGSRDTGRYDLADPEHRGSPPRTWPGCRRPAGSSWSSPTCRPSTRTGETALLFLAGGRAASATRSARVRCSTGPDLGVDGLYRRGDHRRGCRRPAELAVAEKALAAVPGGRGPAALRPGRPHPRSGRRAAAGRAGADRAVPVPGHAEAPPTAWPTRSPPELRRRWPAARRRPRRRHRDTATTDHPTSIRSVEPLRTPQSFGLVHALITVHGQGSQSFQRLRAASAGEGRRARGRRAGRRRGYQCTARAASQHQAGAEHVRADQRRPAGG